MPVSNRVGEENRGWYVGMTITDFECSGIGTSTGTHKSPGELLDRAKSLPAGQPQLGHVRTGFADHIIDAEVSRLFSYYLMSMQAHNFMANYETWMTKMFGSEMNQRIARLHMSLYDLYGLLYDPDEPPASASSATSAPWPTPSKAVVRKSSATSSPPAASAS